MGSRPARRLPVANHNGIFEEEIFFDIKFDDGSYDSGSVSSFDSLTGIVLNEEWLGRAGFEKNESHVLRTFSIDISNFNSSFKIISLTIQKGNKFLYLREGETNGSRDEDDLITIWNDDIKDNFYLHNLQNLFKELTGTELTLNP